MGLLATVPGDGRAKNVVIPSSIFIGLRMSHHDRRMLINILYDSLDSTRMVSSESARKAKAGRWGQCFGQA